MSKVRSNTNTMSAPCGVAIVAGAVLLPLLLTSCGKKDQAGEKKTVQKSGDDFLDKDAKPDERKYLMAAKPFFIAIASRNMSTLTRSSPGTPKRTCSLTSLRRLRMTPLTSNTNRVRMTM